MDILKKSLLWHHFVDLLGIAIYYLALKPTYTLINVYNLPDTEYLPRFLTIKYL